MWVLPEGSPPSSRWVDPHPFFIHLPKQTTLNSLAFACSHRSISLRRHDMRLIESEEIELKRSTGELKGISQTHWTGYIPSVLQSSAQHPIFCGQFFIDIQDLLVLCFLHEKAMPSQTETGSPRNHGAGRHSKRCLPPYHCTTLPPTLLLLWAAARLALPWVG
jgi:hypothetical protein